MSIYNFGIAQRNSQGEKNILWLSAEAEELRMASILAGALSNTVWDWHNPPRATKLMLVELLNRFGGLVNSEIHLNVIENNHHTIHVVDFETGHVSLHDDIGDSPKVVFEFMQYIQRFLK